MPAFADYLDLRLAVADHVGNRDISDVMPRLTQTAESSLNKKLRCRQQIVTSTLVFVDGASALPADFIEMINLYGLNGYRYASGALADSRNWGSAWTRYAIDGTSILIKGYSGDRDIQYYAKLPTLTSAPTATNWLLEDAPDVYLYAVGLEAAKYLKDVDLVQATRALLEDEMNTLKIDDDRARWSNTSVRVQGITP
jgi:hypothetical protein